MTVVWRDERRTNAPGAKLKIHFTDQKLLDEYGGLADIDWGPGVGQVYPPGFEVPAYCGVWNARAITDEEDAVTCETCKKRMGLIEDVRVRR